MKSTAPTTMDEQYEAAASEANDATKNAADLPTAHKHRLAAEAHLAAARHAHMTGKGDEEQAHDAKANEHMRAMNCCDAGAAAVPKVEPLQAKVVAVEKPAAKKVESKALAARANVRMKGNVALMAGIKDGGYSFNDMQSQLRAALDDVDFGDDDAEENQAVCGPSYWVNDILAPAHEQGETWEAVVSGPCNKMYCVKFTIGENAVTIVGTPEQVTQETDYEYVADEAAEVGAMDATKVAALMAENPEGINQYSKGGAADKAKSNGEKAARLSGDAEKTGKAEDHEKAADANTEAAISHTRAAEKAMNNGDKATETYHRNEALGHNRAAWAHNQEAHNIRSGIKAQSAKEDTSLQAKSSPVKRFEMASKEAKDCSASVPALHARAEALHRIAAEHAKLSGTDGKEHLEAADYHGGLKGTAVPIVIADNTAVPVTPSENPTTALPTQTQAK